MPSPLDRDTADHLAALTALLPTGPIWSRDSAGGLGRICTGIAATAARLRARAGALLVDAFPATAFDLLPDWEATLGLPDPCAGPAPSLQLRRAQVAARLSAVGGQSVPYFIGHAAALGFTVTVQEYAPARLGFMRLGDRMRGASWASVWTIQAPLQTITPFRLGQSGLGERFRSWGNGVLECQLRAMAPAHTVLTFQYI
jgi:uncharacterized protein YmfQ (DUF2313 family)